MNEIVPTIPLDEIPLGHKKPLLIVRHMHDPSLLLHGTFQRTINLISYPSCSSLEEDDKFLLLALPNEASLFDYRLIYYASCAGILVFCGHCSFMWQSP